MINILDLDPANDENAGKGPPPRETHPSASQSVQQDQPLAEWSRTAIRVATDATPAAPLSPPHAATASADPQGAAAAAGGRGFDPYAGSAPHYAGSTNDMIGSSLPRPAPLLATPASIGVAVDAFHKLMPGHHGSASFIVTWSSRSGIDAVRMSSGDMASKDGARLAELLRQHLVLLGGGSDRTEMTIGPVSV